MQSTNPPQQIFKWLASNIFLGALVAFYSVAIAYTSFLNNKISGASSGLQNEGMQTLILANTEFLQANQLIIYDFNQYDGYYVHFEERPEIAAYYQTGFSDALQNSLDRNNTPFDDAYYNEMFAEANQRFEEAGKLFERSQQEGNRSDHLQLVTLILSVGLALTAWASLLQEDDRLRLVFSLLALVALVVGIVTYLNMPPAAG